MNICVFASGSGTNFSAILEQRKRGCIKSDIKLLITNNSGCGAVEIAKCNNVDVFHISRKVYPDLPPSDYSNLFISKLEEFEIDLIVLAGYMKMLPPEVVKKFRYRIINIHPALLPLFGGKGMYGINVHKAVIETGVKVTGVTIHFVNEYYDSGLIIFQKCVPVAEDDNEHSLQARVQKAEHECYPQVIKLIEDDRVVIDTGRVRIKAINN